MPTLLNIGLTNAVLVVILGLLVLAITRLWRNPYAARFLWLLVLVKFVTPPMFDIPFPNSGFRQVRSDVAEFSGGSSIQFPFDFKFPRTSENIDHVTPDIVESSTALTQPLKTNPSVNGRVTLPQIVMTVWISGSLLWILVATWRIVRFDRMIRRSPLVDAVLQQQIDSLAHGLGLSRSPQGRLTDASIAPLIWFTRPQSLLIMPAGLLKDLSEQQTETVLVHELSHLKRRDHLVRWFELAVIALFWWHPVLWWAVRQLHNAEEECCDASVLQFFPEQQQLYGETLFQAAEFLNRQPSPPAIATSLGQSHQLKRRLTMILKNRPPVRISLLKRMALLMFAIAVLPLSARAFPAKEAASKTNTAGTQLRWKLKTGETLRYSFQIEDDAAMYTIPEPEGLEQEQQYKSTYSQQLDMEWKVTAINPDGTIAVSMRIPRFTLNQQMTLPGQDLQPVNQNFQFDSKESKADDEDFRKVSQAVTESEYQLLIDSRGKIKKVTLPETLLNTLKQLKVLRNKPYSFFVGFQDFTLEETLNSVLLALPQTAVSKGDEWARKEQRPLADNLVTSNIGYLYNGPTGENLHKIDVNTNTTTSRLFGEDNPADILKLVFKKGANKGNVMFDSNSGRIRKSTYQRTFSMSSKPRLAAFQLEKLSKEDVEKVRQARIVQAMTRRTTLLLKPEKR